MKIKNISKICGSLVLAAFLFSTAIAQKGTGRKRINVPTTISPQRATVGDTVSIKIKAAVTDTFTLNIFQDTSLVHSLTVTGGTTILPALEVGYYNYKLLKDTVVVRAGKFKISAPKVESEVTPEHATIGDTISITIDAPVTESFTLNIYQDTVLVQTLTVTGGTTVLPALPIGKYWYKLIDASSYVVSKGGFEISAPKVEADITPEHSTVGDTVSITIDAPVTESFTLNIYQDTTLVQTLTVTGGTTVLPALPVGEYEYELVNSGSYVVSKGDFEVHAPYVDADIIPEHSTVGDTVSITIDAPVTESFTLNIYQDSIFVQTLIVTGGTSTLPVLPVGKYKYELIDANAYVVNKGKFEVHAPYVDADITPENSTVGDTISITVDAPVTESFTLNIYQDTVLVQTLTVTGGTTVLPALGAGNYKYQLINADSYVVSKGKFKVNHAPIVTTIAPNPSVSGTASIIVDAPVTDSFTLNIYSYSTASLETSVSITGGTTLLPALTPGFYSYKVLNGSGQVVSKGKIVILN